MRHLWISGVVSAFVSTACIFNTTSDGDTDASDTGAADASGPTGGGNDPTSNATTTDPTAADGTAGGGPANDRCTPFCEAVVAAGCDDGPTMPGCLLTCQSLTSAAVCDPTAHAYFDCVDGTTISCNAAGDPVADGCGLLYLEAIGCAVDENPNPAVVEPCNEYCSLVSAAACAANGPEDECQTNCLWLGNTGTGCDGQWATYLECASAADWSCLVGFAVPAGCGTQFTDYSDCINAAGGG